MARTRRKYILLSQCRWWLLWAWAIGTLIGAVYLLKLESAAINPFGVSMADVWKWFLGNTVPTVTLMLGTLFARLDKEAFEDIKVDARAISFSKFLSIGYFILLLFLIYQAQSVRSDDPARPMQLLKDREALVIAIQSALTLVFGAIFVAGVRQSQGDEEPRSTSTTEGGDR